jgi:hypothetical protein
MPVGWRPISPAGSTHGSLRNLGSVFYGEKKSGEGIAMQPAL